MDPANAKKKPKKLMGTVTAEERSVIKQLYERKNGLAELFKSIADLGKEETNTLYEKLVKDMADTSAKYQGWFDAMSRKYAWENIPGHNWEINFDTCEVFLTK
jgi:CXXX repeat modification system protein